MLCKYGKQTRDFKWGRFYSYFYSYFYFLVYFSIFGGGGGAFLIKQLFHSHLLDMRLVIANSALRACWVFTISYPTRAHGIIVN